MNSPICKNCGKPYDFKVESGVDGSGVTWCRHDEDASKYFLHFTPHEQGIISKLPSGQVLAKGSDGFSRVMEIPKKS